MGQFRKTYSLLLLAFLGASILLQTEAKPKPAPEDEWGWGDEEESEAEDDGSNNARSLDFVEKENDPHKGHVMQSAPIPQSPSDPSKSGFSGGNVAAFNESCSNLPCNSQKNLRCDTAFNPPKCMCLEHHTYIRSQEKCFPTWKGQKGHACEFAEQCHDGPTGQLSRCNHQTGFCECFDTTASGKREVVMYNGRCVVKKNFGEICQTDSECETTMKLNAVCAPGDPNAMPNWANRTEICQCRNGFVWETLLKECLKIVENGLQSTCKSSLQCTSSKMGTLSECSRETEKCKCHDATNPGDDNVVFYSKMGTCFQKKFWNSTCTIDEECKASISSGAQCLPAKEETGSIGGTMLLTCQCPPGKKCPLDAGDGGALSIGGNVVNTIAILVLVFYRFFSI